VKKYSIIFTINIIFLISFLLISASFAAFYNFNNQKDRHFNYKRDIEISKIFMHQYRAGGISDELVEYIKSLDFSIILDKNEITNIADSKSAKIKELKSRGMFRLWHIELNDKLYMLIQTPNERVILRTDNISNNKSTILIVYIVTLLIFLFLYLSIINKLKPLSVLKESVKNFGNEDFDLDCFTSNNDEISELANEFHESAKKLKKVKESRNIFIRNIMHELKTPIAKGKFLMQLPQTSQNVEIMQKVFYRLESLINEFAAIEELISTKKELHVKEYFLEDIIDNAIDILMCSDDEVIKDIDNIKIEADFNLFSIAVKNLLDNGIKYAKNKKVIVKTDVNKLIFENSGSKLIYPLESYFEPFFRGEDTKQNQSFGLGLYIVKHILDAHNMSLKYEHENGINRFIIAS